MLRAFEQHGVHFAKNTGDEHIGDCPFCGSKSHFYVEGATKRWQCKRGKTTECQQGGGFQTFLQCIVKMSQDEFTEANAKKLVDDRGIDYKIFKSLGWGYNPNTDCYCFPEYTVDDTGTIQDVRYWKPGRAIMSTAGCRTGLYLWEKITSAKKVWVCEGEWDAAALYSTGTVVCGVPGAGTFKREWSVLFRDKDVILAYDNDEAGQVGLNKAWNVLLNSGINSLKRVAWPSGLKTGYDVRDAYKDCKGDAKLIVAKLESYLTDKAPAGLVGPVKAGGGGKAGAALTILNSNPNVDAPLTGERIDFEEVKKVWAKWAFMPDQSILDVMYGAIIANRIGGEPLWVFLIGPPGCFKTEPLFSLEECPKCLSTSTLTPASLISGFQLTGGIDPSLLGVLDSRMLVIQDFTSVFQMPKEALSGVLGILRAAYDGKVEKAFAHSFKRYTARFGIIAAVTNSVEEYMDSQASLGERFLGYRVPIPAGMEDRRDHLKRARQNIGKEKEMKAELREVSKKVLSHDYIAAGVPAIESEEIETAFDSLALWCAQMRGTVRREKFSRDREVLQMPFVELGTRLVKQLSKMAAGISMVRGKGVIGWSEYNLVRELATGSIKSINLKVLEAIWRLKGADKRAISKAVGLPEWPVVDRVLDDFLLLGLVEGEKVGINKSYTLSKDTLGFVETGKIFH